MKNQFNAVHEIIKYTVHREYFGEWTPDYLHKTFHKISEDPTHPLVFIQIGQLSADVICDALWSEMSYNPLRFGQTNPFEFDNHPDIEAFCKKYKESKETSAIMRKIAHELNFFPKFIKKTNPEFKEKNKIKDYSILITCNYNRKPTSGYKALACLVRCIHTIATQNINDYKIKKYREQIQDVAIKRHPNMKRSNKYINILQFEETERQKNDLYAAITKKNEQILDTISRIEILNGYEPPADTSRDQTLLSRQRQELQTIEERYEFIKNKFDSLVARKNELEKQ